MEWNSDSPNLFFNFLFLDWCGNDAALHCEHLHYCELLQCKHCNHPLFSSPPFYINHFDQNPVFSYLFAYLLMWKKKLNERDETVFNFKQHNFFVQQDSRHFLNVLTVIFLETFSFGCASSFITFYLNFSCVRFKAFSIINIWCHCNRSILPNFHHTLS